MQRFVAVIRFVFLKKKTLTTIAQKVLLWYSDYLKKKKL